MQEGRVGDFFEPDVFLGADVALEQSQDSNREVKSSVFAKFFSDSKNAAELYSALEGVEVTAEDIHFATLEGILFIKRKNDLAFTVKNRVLIIGEHQSTINENMPIRDAIYYGRTAEKLLSDPGAIYRKKRIMIPTPKFFVFYNGKEKAPLEKVLRLSDSYLEKTEEPMLELIVKVININLPSKHKLLEECRPLYEYSWFIQRVKDYEEKGLSRDDAITFAIADCKRENIMTEFMYEHGSEVANMLFGEYNEELEKQVIREEAYEDGFEAGEQRGEERGRQMGIQTGIQTGIQIGEQKGELMKLIRLVCSKQTKGKKIPVIADELEESLEFIEKICAAIRECDGDLEAVYEKVQVEIGL